MKNVPNRAKYRPGIVTPQQINDAIAASGIPDDVSTNQVKPLRDTPAQRATTQAILKAKR